MVAASGAPEGSVEIGKDVGVVYVHGVGSDRYPGSELAKLIDGVVAGLQGAGRDIDLEVDADRKVDGAPVPSATLDVSRTRGDEARDRFRFRGAFWDDAFPPPGADEVLRWVLYGFGKAMDGVFSGWWSDPSASGSTAKERWWKPFMLFGRSRSGRMRLRELHRGPLQRLLFRIELIVLTGVFTPLILLYDFLVRPLTWLLWQASKTPLLSSFGIMAWLSSAAEGLSPFMSRALGDARRITSNETWGRNIRARVEDRAVELLREGVQELVIVAYSGGAMVAYDALLEGRRLPRELAKRPEVRLRLLTFGSGINHLWTFASLGSDGLPQRRDLAELPLDAAVLCQAKGRADWEGPFWRDVYSRFDPVPGGPLRPQIASTAGVERDGRELEVARIVNYDNWVDDHGGYFSNLDQFVPRLLGTLYGNREWSRGERAARWPHDRLTAMRPNRRASAVFSLNLMKLLPLFGLTLHLLALATIDRWRDLSEWAGDWFVDRADAPFSAVAEVLGTTSELVAATALVALVLVVLGWASYAWSLRYIDGGNAPWFGRIFELAFVASAAAFTVGAVLAVLAHLWLAAVAAVALVATSAVLLAIMLGLPWLAPRHLERPEELLAFLEEVRPTRLVVVRAVSTAAVLVGVGGLAAWFVVGGLIHRGALRLEAEKPRNVTVERIDGNDVLLSGSEDLLLPPGLMGLEWDDGYVQVGEPRAQGSRARRRIEHVVAGAPPPPRGEARLDGFAFTGDPQVAYDHRASEGRPAAPVDVWDVAYTYIERDGRDVELRAWIVRPQQATEIADTWVVVVHGKGGTRAEGYRILPALTDLGLTAMLISYRDDRESPQGGDGRYEYGRTEWRDVVAALDFAVRGPDPNDDAPGRAERVILYGYSMGGAIVASTLQHGREWPQQLRRRDRLAAIVLDSPMLDFAETVELGLESLGPAAGLLRTIAGERFGIAWDELAYIEGLAADTRPLLLIHGTEDDLVPIATSRALEDARPDVLLVEVPGAHHTLAWNVRPEGYERCVGAFIGEALGIAPFGSAGLECPRLGLVDGLQY
jgi:dienelactone hydrolase